MAFSIGETNDPAAVSLTINLVKADVPPDQVVRSEQCGPPLRVPISGHSDGTLFIRKSDNVPPGWAELFSSVLDPEAIAVPHVCGIFVVNVRGKTFALTFGQGGRFLLRDNVVEERFGLICALNTVDPKTFRSIDVQSLDAIQSHTRIQSGEATSPDQFGLDVEQDMLKAIVGTPRDLRLGTRMSGHDALSVSVKADLSDLPYLLDQYSAAYEKELSKEDYEWVNNIAIVRDTDLVSELEAALLVKLSARDLTDMWLAIPEVIDWTLVSGFVFTAGKKEAHGDINMAGFLKTLPSSELLTIDLLKSRRVFCVDQDHKKVFKSWSVYRCLYSELESSGSRFILNDGKWFRVDVDFVARTNKAFASIPKSRLTLPIYRGGGETPYNEAVAREHADVYALLDDKKKIMHGGGHGQVEVCDLLSIDKELIHIKIYGKSTVFSHLFAQGFVSGQLIQTDEDFRAKIREKLPGRFKSLIKVKGKPTQDEFTIVYGVISEEPGDLYLPFFSRVNLNNTRKTLLGFGYKVEILKVDVDPAYAKLVKVPPRRPRKR